MLLMFFRRPVSSHTNIPAPTATIEQLESRRFLSASLSVTNADILPGVERMIFNRIQNPNPTKPNYVKDRGVLQLTNTGSTTMTLSNFTFSGPFKLVGTPPTSIPAHQSVRLTVQFIANKTPKFTYNQTSGFDKASSGGAWIGSMTFKTNDPAHAAYKEELAGWFQYDSEKNEEPNLQTLVNLIANYKTNIASGRQVHLTEGTSTPTYYGEEVKSAYWKIANTAKPIGVRQLAAFHTQGDTVPISWFDKATKTTRSLFTTDGLAGQTFLPYLLGRKGTPAAGSFSPGGTVFGFKIQNEFSDDRLNRFRTGGGHHVRFYPLRDHNGNIIQNSYLMTMDYGQTSAGNVQNYDFQDNVYLVNNIVPAGN